MIRPKTALGGLSAIVAIALLVFPYGCGSQAGEKTDAPAETKELSQEELFSRGQYLVSVNGCNDCHTPKTFGPHGPQPDTTRMLSGHPAGDPLPPVDKKALQPGYWILFGPDLTSAVGLWGISFSANLTPDSATGIGTWDEAAFVKALRTGKHMGIESGRSILPPMPWPEISKMTDEDLRAVYTFLRALKPISNRVPNPVPPNEAAAMAK